MNKDKHYDSNFDETLDILKINDKLTEIKYRRILKIKRGSFDKNIIDSSSSVYQSFIDPRSNSDQFIIKLNSFTT
jgi:hypothetical protein